MILVLCWAFSLQRRVSKRSHETDYCSNVGLKDWDGFIDMIAAEWVKNRFSGVQRLGDSLGVYTAILDVPTEKFSAEGAK